MAAEIVDAKCTKCDSDYHQWFAICHFRQHTSGEIVGKSLNPEEIRFCPCCGKKLASTIKE